MHFEGCVLWSSDVFSLAACHTGGVAVPRFTDLLPSRAWFRTELFITLAELNSPLGLGIVGVSCSITHLRYMKDGLSSFNVARLVQHGAGGTLTQTM